MAPRAYRRCAGQRRRIPALLRVNDLRKPYQGRVRVGFTIAKDQQEVYDCVVDPQNWGKFLHAIQLQSRGDGRLRMTIGKAAGIDFDSRVEITEQKPGEYIAWASAEQMLEHRGVMHFSRCSDEFLFRSTKKLLAACRNREAVRQESLSRN